MNTVEKFFKEILDGLKGAAEEVTKTTETNLGLNKKSIQVELPEPPTDEAALDDWRQECNARILTAIPRGYTLKGSEIKEEKIVRHYADLVVEKS